MDPPSPFQYSQLDIRHTRLVELLPGRENEVRIRLHDHAIGSPQRYEALSYIGGPEYSKMLFIVKGLYSGFYLIFIIVFGSSAMNIRALCSGSTPSPSIRKIARSETMLLH